MTIEVIEMTIIDRMNGTVRMTAKNISEERIQFLERTRDDGFEEEVMFEWNTKDERQFRAMRKWLKQQKVTQSAKTFGEAMSFVSGITTESPAKKYRVWLY